MRRLFSVEDLKVQRFDRSIVFTFGPNMALVIALSMIKKFIFCPRQFLSPFVIFLFFSGNLDGQKLTIDSNVYNRWPFIRFLQLSEDGKFMGYEISNVPEGNNTLVIQSTDSKWKKEYPCMVVTDLRLESGKASFIMDSKLYVLDLGGAVIEHIDSVEEFQLVIQQNSIGLLLYKKIGSPRLVVKDLSTGEELLFGADKYWFNSKRRILVIMTTRGGATKKYDLDYINLVDSKRVKIWTGCEVNSLTMSDDGEELAFIGDEEGKTGKLIWVCKMDGGQAINVVDSHSEGLDPSSIIDEIVSFNSSSQQLIFRVHNATQPNGVNASLGLDVWSYKDPKLQSQQLRELPQRQYLESFEEIANTRTKQVLQLAGTGQKIIEPVANNLALLAANGSGDLINEWNWNQSANTSIYLVSLEDGLKKLIKKDIPSVSANYYNLSPDGKYVVYFDPKQRNYLSYEISTCKTRNLTANLNARWIGTNKMDQPKGTYFPLPIAGFVKNSSSVLLYDQFDIYEVDMAGKTYARNLTQGFGRKHHIVLRLAIAFKGPVDLQKTLILSAFDTSSKRAGYFSVSNRENELHLLTMQPVKFGVVNRASNAEVYVLTKMTAADFPNLFTTTDFKHFVQITNIHPEQKYNWMTTELLKWRCFDGQLSQGILYKPQNFDPRKRYPLIFYYYEQLSDGLHNFIMPRPSDGTLDIPLYVSNGYLVFTPDIHYTIGYPGRSAYNSVVSAANYLSKISFIDGKRMGIQGHSFGGFETNYIITHCDKFAAACSSSSMSDFVSIYNSIIGDGTSRQRQYELYRDRIGATLWERPDLYLENSPVLRADKVKTPLLMMANSADDNVPWQQGIELFTALRRLGKKAWMLQYDGEGHTLLGSRASRDFSLRMFQFFNHYLKGMPAPIWMTQGVPARLKNIETGLEIDTSGIKQ